MTKPILYLRLSYWIVAIADFCVAFLVLIPQRMGAAETLYPMGFASAVAFSWGVMLLVADRKPLERKWILIPTILVVALLSITRMVFSLNGAIEFSLAAPLFGAGLIILMAFSYFNANQNAGSDQRK